jgi:hypothetical protein
MSNDLLPIFGKDAIMRWSLIIARNDKFGVYIYCYIVRTLINIDYTSIPLSIAYPIYLILLLSPTQAATTITTIARHMLFQKVTELVEELGAVASQTLYIVVAGSIRPVRLGPKLERTRQE